MGVATLGTVSGMSAWSSVNDAVMAKDLISLVSVFSSPQLLLCVDEEVDNESEDEDEDDEDDAMNISS